jgi:chemotaxis-related protein WspD
MSPLAPVLNSLTDCWNRIGIGGDRSCPELARYVHCHNCPVFAGAGQKLLDSAPPRGYLDEARERLAVPPEELNCDALGALVFRLGEEWLALPVQVLIEVHEVRPVHRIPQRGGLLAGVINIRGELQLCAHLDQMLAVQSVTAASRGATISGTADETANTARLLVVQLDAERWVFPVDEVDQVHRFAIGDLNDVPATVGRAGGRLTRGVFEWKNRTIGFLDEKRLLQALQKRVVA